jgi:hypothetical protein
MPFPWQESRYRNRPSSGEKHRSAVMAAGLAFPMCLMGTEASSIGGLRDRTAGVTIRTMCNRS